MPGRLDVPNTSRLMLYPNTNPDGWNTCASELHTQIMANFYYSPCSRHYYMHSYLIDPSPQSHQKNIHSHIHTLSLTHLYIHTYTHTKYSRKNDLGNEFCAIWGTHLSEIFLRKIIILHRSAQSFSSAWKRSERARGGRWQFHGLPFWGWKGKMKRKWKLSSSLNSELHKMLICFLGKICVYLFLEKLAQTINQNEAKCLSSLRVHVLS